MKVKDKNIFLTNHAKLKMKERNISLTLVEKAITNPDLTVMDKLDSSVLHVIKKIGTKYLRVLMRTENKSNIIITAFFDRRIKVESKND